MWVVKKGDKTYEEKKTKEVKPPVRRQKQKYKMALEDMHTHTHRQGWGEGGGDKDANGKEESAAHKKKDEAKEKALHATPFAFFRPRYATWTAAVVMHFREKRESEPCSTLHGFPWRRLHR